MPASLGSIPWNKGLTKSTHPGLARIAKVRRLKNNFAGWRNANPIFYASLKKSEDLAELYGTLLGDGYIEKFPRTERIDIAFNSKEVGHITHVDKLIQRIFRKNPAYRKDVRGNCVHLSLYQKDLSKRLEFPLGRKKKHDLRIPGWIKKDKKYLIPCLKGLFETDGSWVIDPKYNTNCINYTSIHTNLLKDIYDALRSLGLFACLTTKRVTLNRRLETVAFAKLIKFRQY